MAVDVDQDNDVQMHDQMEQGPINLSQGNIECPILGAHCDWDENLGGEGCVPSQVWNEQR